MSFILDALRKSEIERQRDSAPSLIRTPQATIRRETPIWTWLLIVLLALALAGLAGAWWLRDRGAPAADDAGPSTAAPDAIAGPGPAATVATSPDAGPAPGAPLASGEPRPFVDILRVDPGLPSYSLSFLEFNASDSARSSAWINGRRYYQGQLVEGGLDLVAIRADGVVLAYRGQTYLLKP
jgi:Type II secretion system protein B